MTILVDDLMTKNKLVAYQTDTIVQIRRRMLQNGVRVLPVVNQEWEAVGIVTAGDLFLSSHADTPVSKIMSTTVHTISHLSSARVAARVMRKNNVQQLVVVQDAKVIGLLTVFDLLQLLENSEFELKHPQQPTARGHGIASAHSS